MASRRNATRGSTTKAPPVREKYAWHIVTGTGADVTVSAHECDHYDGVLTFRNHTIYDGDRESVLVRAFGPGRWAEVEMVDVSTVPGWS